MGANLVKIAFLVVALGVVLFILRSGVISNFALPSSPFNPFSVSTSTPKSYSWQTENPPAVPAAGGWTPSGVSSSAGQWQGGSTAPQNIPKGFTASQLSPYFNAIKIGSVSPGSIYSYGQVSLYAISVSAPGGVDVTGWLLKGNRGSQVVPKAVNVYDPSGLSGEGDIRLSNNDTLNLYTSQSAIGENLRMNKCIGYLENNNHFTPQLPLNCPVVDRSEISNLTGVCQNLLTSINSCGLPPVNPLLAPTDYACKNFLTTINYKGCFDRHSGDADFLGHEWRAWTGARFLDPSHDALYLFDRQGLLVDTYSY